MVGTTNHEGRGRRSRHPDHAHDPELGPRLREFFDPRRMRRAMVRRGVRAAILALLLDEPMHGYQVITELEARTGGRWRPSAGSVYPTLQQLEDEGLVRGQEQEGRKVYTLTDAGRTEAQESPFTRHPWFGEAGRGSATDLRRQALQLARAAMQVSREGSADAQEKARQILADSRRQLYRLLADDALEPTAPGVDAGGDAPEASEGGAA